MFPLSPITPLSNCVILGRLTMRTTIILPLLLLALYRTADGYATLDLAIPSYNIEAQDWVTAPLAANAGVWTAPYFDAGGGEILMITRSVPARDAEGIFAIITTDLPVDTPVR